MTIRVTTRLHGNLEERTGGPAEVALDLPEGVTLLDVQDRLGIPRGEVGLFVVDGEWQPDGSLLRDAATVDIYPMFGGG